MRRRWVGPVDRGASVVEYGGLLVLLSAIVAVVVAAGVPGRVTSGVRNAVCTIFDQSGCAEGQQPTAGGPPEPNQPGTGQTGPAQPQAPGQTGDTGDTGQPGGAQTEDALSEQFDEAEQAAELAELDAAEADREAAEADRQGGDPAEIARELAIEASGLGDAKRCITEGDLAGCGWTALTFVPVAGWLGRGGKAAKAANKARQLMERFRAFKRIGDAARRRAAALREQARLARERAQTLCNTNSFVAGTPVLLADGTYKPIEDVDIGDRVLAADPVTGRAGPRNVTDLIVGTGEKRLVTLTIDIAGRTDTITATDGHPFWAAGERRWTAAVALGAGDRLGTTGDTAATVRATRTFTQVERVYNLTVAGLHTYHVAVGGTDVLVHNAAPCIRVSVASQDWATKGAHVHVGKSEVRIFPDGNGGVGVQGIRLRTGSPSAAEIQQVQDAIRSDPQLRANLIRNAREVMERMNSGEFGMNKNRAAEMNFLIKALEKMG